MGLFDFLSKERTIAGPGFNRWLVPPAALAIHLCIGMAYGFSVFWLPLSKAIGIKESVACGADLGFMAQIFSTTCDWKISMLGWMYTMFFVFLGLAAWLFGGLAFLLQLRFTAARYWLPFAAPGVLAVLGRASDARRWTAVGLTTALALALSVDDMGLAKAQEELAILVDGQTKTAQQRAFSGHWGWQHHLEARGWTAVEEDQPLAVGTLWAVSAVSWPQDPTAGCFEERARFSADSRPWLPRPRRSTG